VKAGSSDFAEISEEGYNSKWVIFSIEDDDSEY
jgi:hypothetical protein